MRFIMNGVTIGELLDGEMLKVEVPAGEQILVVSFFAHNPGYVWRSLAYLTTGTDETTIHVPSGKLVKLTVEFGGINERIRFVLR